MDLLSKLRAKPFCNDVHFFLIAVILLILGLKYYFILIFLFLYLLFILKKTKYIIPILLILLLFLMVITSLKLIRQNNKRDNYIGRISEVNDKYYVLNTGLFKVKCYEYNHNYTPGDVVEINISLYDDNKSYEYDFDNEEYLYSKGISYNGKIKESKLLFKTPSIFSLKYYYLKYLKTKLSDYSYKYTEALIFGKKEMDSDILDAYSILGISHILAISGLHIILLFKIISFILQKLFSYHGDFLPTVLILFFVLLIGMPPSAFRAALFLALSGLNKKGKIKYTKLDILSFSAILMLLLNPYSLFSISFILSYLVSFIIIFSDDLITGNNKLLNKYKLYLVIYVFTLPFVVRTTNQISLISILLSPILSTFIGYLLLPISLILSVFPVLDIVLKYVFIFLNTYILNLSGYGYVVYIESFNIYKIIIYYVIASFVLLTLAIKKYRLTSISILILYLIFIFSFKFIDLASYVTYMDVGQGDSALIRLKQNKGNILIDCYNSFDYLKRIGIKNIDYMVLTHSDSDHTGDYEKIYKYFNVKKIIYPKYDNGFETLLEGYLNKEEVDYTSKLYIDEYSIDVLGPINAYEDPNSNSIVLKMTIDNSSFLFTGDMTKNEEIDLINKYGSYLDSDFLKVAHHGSNTSSCSDFLKLVNPKNSIISVGLNNKYHHPSDDVVDRLKKYGDVYISYERGNITYKIINNKVIVSTYR